MRVLLIMLMLGLSLGSVQADDGRNAAPQFLNSGDVLTSDLPFSEAVVVSNLMFLSGQIGIKPGSKVVVSGGIEAEARQTMDNIKSTLETHGRSMADLVKCTVMLADIAEWGAFNEVYKTYFTPPFPARSAFAASGLALNARVEVECIAAVSQ